MPKISINRQKSIKGGPFKWYAYLDERKIKEPLKNKGLITLEIPAGHHSLYVEDHLKAMTDILDFEVDEGFHMFFECGPKSMLKTNVFNPFKLGNWLKQDYRAGIWLRLKEVVEEK
jgi:hypothetical protein